MLALLQIITLCTMAVPVSQKQALQKARSFASSLHRKADVRLKMAYASKKNAQEAHFYVYNIGHHDGFVVVSGNDQSDAILGYTDKGDFDYDQMPDNMKAWLDHLRGQLSIVVSHSPAPRRVTNVHPTTVIQPLITTTWAQVAPYNEKCPVIDDVHCKTGCTATALAQVLRFHEYPSGKTTKIPGYTTSTLKIVMPELAATTFNWSKMPDKLTSDTPQDEIDEVAKLMLYCGQMTDMNYTPSGSGAFTYKIPDRLPTYFGYPKTMHYLYRESYDEASWDSLLVKELEHNQPVIYTAYTNLNQGHTFICDGYDGNGLYHINWGWNGVGNGYFRISVAHATDEALNEEIKNYHLSMRQTALVGLKPAGTDDYVAPKEYYRAYSRPSLKEGRSYSRASSDVDFTGITFKQSFVNTSSSTRRLSHGTALYNEAGLLVEVLATSTANLAAGGTKTYESASLSFGKDLEPGHYTIKPVYKRSSSADWIPMAGTDKNYIDVVLKEEELTLTPVPKADFKVNSLKRNGSFLTMELENDDEGFYGPIYLRVEDPETGIITQISNDVLSFDPASSTTFDLYIDDDVDFDLENDRFYLSVDEYNTQYFYCNDTEQDNYLEKSIAILNQDAETGEVVGDRIMFELTLKNVTESKFNDEVSLTLTDNEGNVYEEELPVELAAGEELTLYKEFVLSDFDKTYVLTASHMKNTYTTDEVATDELHVAEGAIYWTKDGIVKTQKSATKFVVPEEALAINLHNAYKTNVTPNSNPNTIYMLNRTVPKGLVGKNYVNGANKGDKLTLTDGYDFFIPTELTFSGAITYQRTFSSADSLWLSSIYLPFAPKEVTADGEPVAWKKSADDEAGFWLMSFEQVDDEMARITTSYPDTMVAYTPYFLVPDSQLVNKTVIFKAQKQTLLPTNYLQQFAHADCYGLIGSHCLQPVTSGYVQSDSLFVHADVDSEVEPFRVFLNAGECLTSDQLSIDFYESIAPMVAPTPGSSVEILLGDANGDGTVDISDVLLTVDYILGKPLTELIKENVNLNADETIDISDVLMIVDIILGK